MEISENYSLIENTTNNSSYYDYNFDFISDLRNFILIASYITLVICPLGIISNFSFIFVVARVASMRTNVNFYLINLAVADTVYLVINLIENSLFVGERTVAHLEIYEGFYGFLLNMALFASLFIVLVVSLERYLAICWPTWIIHFSLRWRTAIFISLAWGLALLITAFLTVNQYVYISRAYQEFVFYKFVIVLIIVPIIVLVVYSLIARAMIKRQRYLENIHSNRQNLAENRQIVRLLVATVIFFFLLDAVMLASKLYLLVTYYGEYDLIMDLKFTSATLVVMTLKSSGNSIIFTISSKNYREAFIVAFRCRFFQKMRHETSSTPVNLHKSSPINSRTKETIL